MNDMKVECDVGQSFEDRGCTDILCLIFFLVFIGAMLYLTFYSYVNGDSRMYKPVAGITYEIPGTSPVSLRRTEAASTEEGTEEETEEVPEELTEEEEERLRKGTYEEGWT